MSRKRSPETWSIEVSWPVPRGGVGHFFLSTVGQSAGDLGAAKRPGEDGHRKRQEHGGKTEQNSEGTPDGCDVRSSQERGAHRVQRVGDGIEPRNQLQPIRQYADREKHAAGNTGNSKEKPFRGIAALEEQKIARGQNSQPRECQQRN